AEILAMLVLLAGMLVLLVLVDWVIRKVLVNVLTQAAKRSTTRFDDHLVQNGVLIHLARIVPLSLAVPLVSVGVSGSPPWIGAVQRLLDILLIICWTMLIRALLRSLRDHLRTKPRLADKPLDSYLQVANIFLFFIAGVIIFTTLTGKSPWAFLGAMGAASAILMLVFKDTILGFVASIQVSTNDMVRVGDWIEMPKYGADGDVIEINLNTVKVQNWDKTISTIPTYYLITDSVKNWRGMSDSGGRRIKRAINIKMSSIRYLVPEEIAEL